MAADVSISVRINLTLEHLVVSGLVPLLCRDAASLVLIAIHDVFA
jgi:hypothetical protein